MNGSSPGRPWVKILLVLISLSIAAFWVWALFFPPSKQSVAKVTDEAWTERAEAVCRRANEERDLLTDLRRVSDAGPDALTERAELIEQATDIIEIMVADVMSETLALAEDRAIASQWADMYTTLIADRRIYIAQVRDGANGAFAETTIDGAPISEYINDFTVANRMKACSSPADLAV